MIMWEPQIVQEPLIMREQLINRILMSGRSWTSQVFNAVITLDTYQFVYLCSLHPQTERNLDFQKVLTWNASCCCCSCYWAWICCCIVSCSCSNFFSGGIVFCSRSNFFRGCIIFFFCCNPCSLDCGPFCCWIWVLASAIVSTSSLAIACYVRITKC